MKDPSIVSIGCTCFRLKKLTRAVSRLYDQHVVAVGLKTTQYSLLKCVAYRARPIAELAAFLHMERTTMTRNLEPLLDAGWVELKAGADSRQRIVTITDAVSDLIDRAKAAWRDAHTSLSKPSARTWCKS